MLFLDFFLQYVIITISYFFNNTEVLSYVS